MNSAYVKQALKAGLIAGTLDISAAFIQYFIRTGKNPLLICKYISSAVFGKEALTGGAAMIVTGFVFHYFIAVCFACFFFWLAANIPSFTKNFIGTGIAYGLIVWMVMNLVVVPLSRTPKPPFNITGAITAALILIVCIGIPVSYFAARSRTVEGSLNHEH